MTQPSISVPQATASQLQQELSRLKTLHHSNCMFFRAPPVAGLTFQFQSDGSLTANMTFESVHQGYDGRVHGGLIAAIIDASMTQCLMGHGVLAYTVELSVRYREPINVTDPTRFETRITGQKRGLVYTLEASVCQGTRTKVRATGKFYKAGMNRHSEENG